MTTPAEVSALAQQYEFVDFRFPDLPGKMHHFTMPSEHLTEDAFEEGFGFDGSSIRGFQSIEESDMLLIPDPTTAYADPFYARSTLAIHCFIKDPISGDWYHKDPRRVARNAEEYLLSTGIADVSYWGPEAEFFIFDKARYSQVGHQTNLSFYEVDSGEAAWNSLQEGDNLGHQMRHKEAYFPLSPNDTQQDIRSDMVAEMMNVGIPVEIHHHEVGTAGQAEIDIRYAPLLVQADRLMMYKYICKNVALQAGKTVTFMPKPIFSDNGSGMHTHQSLWKDGVPLFYEEGTYANLSDMARWYAGGLIAHAPAILAFAAPGTNSYRRLVPGFEAPVNLVYSQRNRSAAIRIPTYSEAPAAKRLEFRCPDPSCNPYYAFAAMLMAGLDGVRNQIDPGEPVDVDLYELSDEEAAGMNTVPGTLDEALDALEADHDFLTEGGVFHQDLIDTWISYKRDNEASLVRRHPTPVEYELYYDI
ncbi:MAG: type I glutamate--ammonia ligase [bacterium]|nr:type I glutamate--ammonia ligase [bacterium]